MSRFLWMLAGPAILGITGHLGAAATTAEVQPADRANAPAVALPS